jgi:hypothetical protein
LVKLKSSKDQTAFQNSIKKLNADHKAETQAIADLANGLKGSDAADKIAELQKFDRLVDFQTCDTYAKYVFGIGCWIAKFGRIIIYFVIDQRIWLLNLINSHSY